MRLSFSENVICLFFASLSLLQIPLFRYMVSNDVLLNEGEEKECNVDYFDNDKEDALKYIHIEIKDTEKNKDIKGDDGDEQLSLLAFDNEGDKNDIDDLFL